MKILGIGLSKTGTTSLSEALDILGYKGIHFDTTRLNELVISGTMDDKTFKIYDDVDYVTDLPTAYYYKELLKEYPECRIILTRRETEQWWKSMEKHVNRNSVYKNGARYIGPLFKIFGIENKITKKCEEGKMMQAIRRIVYGSERPIEYLYKKKYDEFYERALADFDGKNILIFDIFRGDGWSELCNFLDKEIPNCSFPHANKA